MLYATIVERKKALGKLPINKAPVTPVVTCQSALDDHEVASGSLVEAVVCLVRCALAPLLSSSSASSRAVEQQMIGTFITSEGESLNNL